jgi:DNA-binding LacI/PurR family transcriptional regulator
MRKAKEVTIYDIPKKLNVSPATISRGLQNHQGISRKTKKRIPDMVEEMGYRTNHFAGNLRQQLTTTIGVDAAMNFLKMKPLPDGAFITNDFVAAVCMRTLKEYGVSIPGDIAIAGFNNDAIGKLIEPALTTINYPGEEMGEIAARNPINHLKGISNIHQTNTIVVRSELIIGKSSLKNHG